MLESASRTGAADERETAEIEISIMPRPTVSIRFHSQAVTARDLTRAISNLTALLGSIDRSVSGEQDLTSKWVIQEMRSSEPMITLRHEPRPNRRDVGSRIVQAVIEVVEEINASSRAANLLHKVPTSILQKAEGLSSLGGNISITGCWNGQPKTVRITETTGEKLKPYTSYYESLGTVEGILRAVSFDGNLKIHNPLYDRDVQCVVDTDMVERAIHAFGLRIAARGLVRMDRGGNVVRIRADQFEVMPSDEELPSIEDMRGAIPGLTGDMNTEDFVRVVRNDW